ncbi:MULTISPECIES: hypothetical protein [unclassified Streptomyces]|uniref:hypothetical protein n=1 Tax=unclassified Streptomyces TaxID=2593676 RepID=UPI00225277EF|nr:MULTISPECIES: hypothetical protein [unclassified Streptomyces]MCX4406461.1 hypothetical protein [Streptomyces sp. NBC_01764]MCX5189014.1 hypothetical protein [Streptomyces sp. NBC_00268]
MSIHPGIVEDLAAGTRTLYEQAEERLLGIVARQLADGLEAPEWDDSAAQAEAAAILAETGAAAPDPVGTFPAF